MASNAELAKLATDLISFTKSLQGEDSIKIESLTRHLAESEYIKNKATVLSSCGCNKNNSKVKCKCVQIGYITLPTIPIALACKPEKEQEFEYDTNAVSEIGAPPK